MSAAREAWFDKQIDLDPDSLVFIDETAAATNMVRSYGRSPRGERCRISAPHGHYKTTTVTAALRTSGLVATTLFDGATSGERFLAYVTDTLVPVLKRGDTVILDNLSVHKVAGVRKAVAAAGRTSALSPGLQTGLQPDRASLRQTEGAPANRSCAHRPRPLGRHPRSRRCIQTQRMPKLCRRCWIRCLRSNMTGNGSKPLPPPTMQERADAAIAARALKAAISDPSCMGARSVMHLDLSGPRRGEWHESWEGMPGFVRMSGTHINGVRYRHACLPGWEYARHEIRAEMIPDLELLAERGIGPTQTTNATKARAA